MSQRAVRSFARFVLLLLLVAEGFAAAPQLHGHGLGAAAAAARDSRDSRDSNAASGARRGGAPLQIVRIAAAPRAGSPERDCPACRLASLARILTGTGSLVRALPRACGAPCMQLRGSHGVAIDCPCGRAPPLA